jgi:hypothetical protein
MQQANSRKRYCARYLFISLHATDVYLASHSEEVNPSWAHGLESLAFDNVGVISSDIGGNLQYTESTSSIHM